MRRISQSLNMLDQIKQLESAVTTDFLTQLKNRLALVQVGNMPWSQANLNNAPELSVPMLDIDYFKQINDTYDLDVGDAILRDMADILKNGFRDFDLLFVMVEKSFALYCNKHLPKIQLI